MAIGSAPTCDFVGCGAVRKEINHWFVVVRDDVGVHIYEWDKAPAKAMKEGSHFCGLAHAFQHASNTMTPDNTVANRESTLELKPPLTRDGTAPIEVLETIPEEPEKSE